MPAAAPFITDDFEPSNPDAVRAALDKLEAEGHARTLKRYEAIRESERQDQVMRTAAHDEINENAEKYRELELQIGAFERDRRGTTEDVAVNDRRKADVAKFKLRSTTIAKTMRATPRPLSIAAVNQKLTIIRRLPVREVPVDLSDASDDPLGALQETTADMEKLHRKKRGIEFAPLPLDEAWPSVREEIATLAARGKPNVSEARFLMSTVGGRDRRQGAVRWPMTFAHGSLNEVIDGNALLFNLFEDEIADAMKAQMRDEASGNEIPRANRAPQIAELDRQLRALEYREAALVALLETTGSHRVFRRQDMEPFAALGIDVG